MATVFQDNDESYDSSSIKVLEGLRRCASGPRCTSDRPVNQGLHHLVYEVVDNSVDEALAGYCTEISVTIHSDDSVTVVDNGRGIPVDMHEGEGVSAAQVVMTKLHAGGKFDSNTYKVPGGLHGVGVSCVNALSETFHLEIWRAAKGDRTIRPGSRITSVAFRRLRWREPANRTRPARRSHSKPDTTIMTATTFDFDILANRLRQLAFLNKGLQITLTDERGETERTGRVLL